MLDLGGINVRDRNSLDELQSRLRASLGNLGSPRIGTQRYYRHINKNPCIDSKVGSYLEQYGLDLVCDLYEADSKGEMQEEYFSITKRRMQTLKKKVPDHLDRCNHCLARSYVYVHFIRERLPVVSAIAQDALNRIRRVGPLLDEEIVSIFEAMSYLAYQDVISMRLMRSYQEVVYALNAVPCTEPNLSRHYAPTGIIHFCEQLLSSTFQLQREKSPLRTMAEETRYRMVRRISTHVGKCAHCTTEYDFEKEERARRDAAFRKVLKEFS